MVNDIKLSVIVITYNHVKYISQALDSILMQKTNFKFEILVGDDGSKDGTRDILREYKKKYPDRIRLKLWKKNMGATKNDYFLKKHAKGMYLAQLEGDDYWTDPNKLQIQVDFLEKHKEFIACTHDFITVDENGEARDGLKTNSILVEWMHKSRHFTSKDINGWKLPGHTGTYVYHNIFKDHDYSILYKAHPYVGDRTMCVLLACQGDIYRIDRVMSHYRYVKKSGGTNWFSLEGQNFFVSYDFFFYVRRLEKYAKKTFGVSLDIKTEKHKNMEDQLQTFWAKPTIAKWKCVWRMLMASNSPLEYAWLILRKTPYLLYLTTVPEAVRIEHSAKKLKKVYKNTIQTSWKKFEKDIKHKKLVVFGAGHNEEDFYFKYYYKYHPSYLVDNDLNKWGYSKNGLLIQPPAQLEKEKDKVVVLITISEYTNEIAEQLEDMGIKDYYSYPMMEYKKSYYGLYRLLNK